MSIHKCDALLITCIDFRFVKHIKNWTNFYFEHKNYDHVSFAGSSKELDTILRQIEISVKLHDAVEVVLVHHEDCGAYGKESTERRHIADLKKAKTAILKKFPHLDVKLFYLMLNGTFKPIE